MVGFFSALLGAAAGGAAVCFLVLRWHYAPLPPVSAGKIQVTELTLVDPQNRPAARLAVEDDGVVLRFLREDASEAVELRAQRRGSGAESLRFTQVDDTGRVILATSAYGATLDMGNGGPSGPMITLGAEEPSDIPSSEPAGSWGLFFRGFAFRQPDPHDPVWVRVKPREKRQP